MKTDELKKLNIRLFTAMTELETNWDGLAKYLGVTRTFITSVRKGDRNLGTETLKKLKELEKETGLTLKRNTEDKPEKLSRTSEEKNQQASCQNLKEQLKQAQIRENNLMEIIKNLSRNGVR